MTQIKLRRDTAANFSSKNPILGNGEPAYETDTKKLKIGDGTTAYTQLAYFSTGGGGGSVDITATLPLKIVDGVISLDVDGQTIQIVDGKLHANLDELGNEVNTLAGKVTSIQADLLKKQDGLVSASPIEIKKSTGLTVVGTPISGSDFVMDNISNTSYCLFPENLIAIGNDYQFKFTTPAVEPTTYEKIFDFGDPLCPQWDYTSHNISVWAEPQGWQPIILNATLNTTYYIRMKMVSTLQMQCCYSTDGITFTEWATVELNSTNPWNAGSNHHIGISSKTDDFHGAWAGSIDLKECYVITNGVKYYMFPDAKTEAIGISLGSGLAVANGKLTATGGGTSGPEKYGLEGDYCSKYGIVDCGNGILKEGTKQVTLKAGVVMQMTETDGLTTNASDIPHTITSTVDFDLFYTSGSLLEATKTIFSEQEPDNGTTGAIAWYNGTQWQFKSNDAGNVWRAAPAVRLAHIHMTDGNITRIDYIGNRHLNEVIPVTTDTSQIITGNKTFKSRICTSYPFIFDCREGNARFDVIYSEKATGNIVTSPVILFDLDKFSNSIRFGLNNVNLQIIGNLIDEKSKKLLTQSSVTGTDNVTITETTDGIQVVGLSNSAIASLSGMTNNMTVYTNVVSGTEYTPTEAGYWVAQGNSTGKGLIAIDMKDQQNTWVTIANVNPYDTNVYVVTNSPLIAAGESIRIRHTYIGEVAVAFIKVKGGVQ